MAPGTRARLTSNLVSAVPITDPQLSRSSQGSNNNEDGSSSSNKSKKGRGKARGLELAKLLEKGQKAKIVFPPGCLKPVGNWSSNWATELGIICRSLAPVTIKKWKNIIDEDKEVIYGRIFDIFDMDMSQWNVRKGTEKYLQQRFRSYRCYLNAHYKELKKISVEAAKTNPPDDIKEEDWKICCELFEDPAFLKQSEKNTHNRKCLKVNHCTGRKAFVQVRYELGDKENEVPLDRIELYRKTHRSSKGWTSDIAQANYEKIIELKCQPTSDGRMLTAYEICDMVLGTKPGYVRGVGHGEFCPSSSQSRRYSDMEDSRRRAEEAEKKAEELIRELEVTKQELGSTKQELGVVQNKMDQLMVDQGNMRTMFESFMSRFGGHTTLSSGA